MSQGLFSNRILATNRQKKNHCCQVLHVRGAHRRHSHAGIKMASNEKDAGARLLL
jgi:hypothetical protein